MIIHNIMNDIEEDCSICGLSITDKYCYELPCKHKFHYECLMKTFMKNPKLNNKNYCPYCRSESGNLPIVNGLKKILIGVHVNNYSELNTIKLKNEPCKYILKKGKNKGEKCGKNCFLGYDYCKIHTKKIKS